MKVEYFTCVSCGGLLRQQLSEPGEPWQGQEVVWVVAPFDACPHPWWDESGSYFKPVPAELAAAMIADGAPPLQTATSIKGRRVHADRRYETKPKN